MQGVPNELVDDVGAVELRRIDVVDAELDRAARDCSCRRRVRWRPEDAGAGELYRAEPDAVDGVRTEATGLRGARHIAHRWTCEP